MAREALGVVGAAVGYIYGGPTGAQIGFTIGYGIGSYLDPVKIPAPGMSEAPIQTSRDGVPIPIIWGLQYCHGNILQKNPEEIVTTTERQGKGGSTKVETKTRFRTFAIGVCEGPVAEVVRIWENNKLVYDVRAAPAIPLAETTKYAEGITIYLGTETQLPDPELEAHWTAAETPAYRGLCYIVWNNKDLTDTGGAIPQFAFEVNASSGFAGTSHVYALEFTDATDQTAAAVDGALVPQPIESIENTAAPQNGLLGGALETYSWTEATDQTATPQNGTLADVLEEYEWTEATDQTATPQDGLLSAQLIVYTSPDEAIENTATPQNGTLS